MNSRESYTIVEMKSFKKQKVIRFASFGTRHKTPEFAIRKSSIVAFYEFLFTALFLAILVIAMERYLRK